MSEHQSGHTGSAITVGVHAGQSVTGDVVDRRRPLAERIDGSRDALLRSFVAHSAVLPFCMAVCQCGG